ncbi:MAG: hypothetical protein HGA57_05545 [Chlorobium limicola]|mgnify:CR=1 FL=1|uniref:Porin n=1 Tax=Chlorobium limicola (strain DSM 245 / NBRC 103803 / 6330) TaxID=290315 RepID=B3EIV6_CHLL2|nr:hypothetical protein [Chlorobium limicola]ACD90047.1 conserved hypothetical protein [Chlorobium limicola DSM 245]NTV20836.1 hypothetical protein [Chlorobium limicola]
MKKSVKIASLAIALFAGLGSTAQAEGFKIGADVVSSYVWRGTDYGDSPAIQPNLSYTFPGIGVVVGAWGSYAVAEDNDERYKEVDLYVTVPVGPFSFTLTDYYIPVDGNSDSFDFSDDGPNVLEASVGYSYKNLGLLAAINIAGADTDNAKYCEATYKFYDKDGFTAKAVVGAGDETYVEGDNDNFTVVNTGISVAKDRFTASYIYNPDSEKSHLVFMASF